VDAGLSPGSVVDLPSAAALHLARVLRARSGDELVLFTGDGREFAAAVESVRGSRMIVAVGEAREVDRESPLAVTLVQCIARGDRMDAIVQKATELGVARIVPVLSRRGVVRLDAAQADSKTAHWRGIAVGACEQCGRNRLPHIAAPRRLIDYLAEPAAVGSRLVLEPDSETAHAPRSISSAVEIAIGPEGGFDAEELDAFQVCGFARVRLGPRVLRTETAAIAALTWLQSRYGDLGPSVEPV
jgi:16S rRNA (uracil1498-N3)-methyltransferase